MVSKCFVTTGVLCAALLLGGDANVYGRGGGGGGGGHGGGGHGGYGGGGHGGYGRGYGGGYGGGFYGGGFYGGGLFYGDYNTGGGYPGYYAPYAYPSPAPYYANPVSPYSSPRISSYPPIGGSAAPAYFATPFAARPAGIHVVLPDPQATVLFDGHRTTSTGGERFYNTPDLTPGESYRYQLRATWMQDGRQVTQEQTVTVTPGQTSEVVFPRQASELIPTAATGK